MPPPPSRGETALPRSRRDLPLGINRQEVEQGSCGLLNHDAVAQQLEHVVTAQPRNVGDVTIGKPHQELDETGGQLRASARADLRGRWRYPSKDGLPAKDGGLVLAPLQNTSSSVSPVWCWLSAFRPEVAFLAPRASVTTGVGSRRSTARSCGLFRSMSDGAGLAESEVIGVGSSDT